MPTSLRWFKIDPFAAPSVKHLSEGLLAEKYNDERGWGFQLSEVRKDFIVGRYIVKEKRVERFRNPDGEAQAIEYFAFREIEFRVQSTFPHLEISSPARGLAEMFNLIGKIFVFEISIAAVEIEPVKWVKLLKQEFGNALVLKAVISDIQLSTGVAASITLAGSEDVQKHFREIVKERKYILDSAIISFTDDGLSTRFEATRTGRLKILTASEDHSSEFFRTRVAKLI